MASVAILIVTAVVGFTSFSLLEKQAEYKQKEEELTEQINEQHEREEELKDFEAYTKTKAYVEEVAKEKLGLVYENEIILKKDN